MILSSLLSLIAPHDCIGCGAEGRLLCRRCEAHLEPAIERCYRCHAATFDGYTCLSCLPETAVTAVYAATRYVGAGKDIVWKLKFGRASSAASEIGKLIAFRLSRKSTGRMIVTYIPTATSRARQRGYDQAELIARAVARKLGLPCYPLLTRQNDRKQVGSSRETRTTQLDGAFRAVRRRFTYGATILLIDDVVTTGATLEAAATVLMAAGAAKVEAAVFAQA
jgi:ComF family protein